MKTKFLKAGFLVILLLYMLPLLVTVTNSFMGKNEVARTLDTIRLIPEKATLSQYASLLFDSPVYLHMFWNSVRLALPILLGQLLTASFAAYAFTVLQFRGKEAVYFCYIVVMLLPLQVTLLPNYLVADWLGIEEGYAAIILPAIFHPMGVFLLRQYLKRMPEAYIEAARTDGAGYGSLFFYIMLPMMKPALAALAMLTLLDNWNLVEQAVIFIREKEAQPLSLFLAQIQSADAGLAFAGACFYAMPAALLLLYGQDDLKKGISIAGLKG